MFDIDDEFSILCTFWFAETSLYVYFIVDHDDTADSTEHTGQAHPDQTEAAHQSEDC